MMAIQAVDMVLKDYERLLTSETLRNPEEIQEMILCYEKTATELKEAYLEEWTEANNLPNYDKLVK